MEPIYISAWGNYTNQFDMTTFPQDWLVWQGSDGSLVITHPTQWDVEDFDDRVDYVEAGTVAEWLHED